MRRGPERPPGHSLNVKLGTSRTFDEAIDEVRGEIRRLRVLGSEPYWLAAAALAEAGKMVRPKFMLTALRALEAPNASRSSIRSFIRDVAAFELVHTSTLIHDDIIDKSDIRRGRPALHAQFGETTALLVGNSVKDEAIRLATLGTRDALNLASLEINRGQLWETQLRDLHEVGIDDFLLVSLFKSGRLFRHALNTSARYADAELPDSAVIAIEAVAIAYQAADDWLDVANAPAVTAKSGGRDETNGVHSFMRALLDFQISPVIDRQWLDNIQAVDVTRRALKKALEGNAASQAVRRLIELPIYGSRSVLLDFIGFIRLDVVRFLDGSSSSLASAVGRLLDAVSSRVVTTKVPTTPHFDRLAPRFDELRPVENELLDRVSQLLMLRPGQTLLDLGCGTGRDLQALSSKYALRPQGVDISAAMARRAASRLGSNAISCEDATSFVRASRDVYHGALIKFSLHHFRDWPELFGGLAQRLEAGSKVVVVTMFPEQVANFPLRSYFPSLVPVMMEAAEAQQNAPLALREAGFRSITVEPFVVGELDWDPSLLNKIQAGFISFVDLLSRSEMSDGITTMTREMRESPRPLKRKVLGTVLHAHWPG